MKRSFMKNTQFPSQHVESKPGTYHAIRNDPRIKQQWRPPIKRPWRLMQLERGAAIKASVADIVRSISHYDHSHNPKGVVRCLAMIAEGMVGECNRYHIDHRSEPCAGLGGVPVQGELVILKVYVALQGRMTAPSPRSTSISYATF